MLETRRILSVCVRKRWSSSSSSSSSSPASFPLTTFTSKQRETTEQYCSKDALKRSASLQDVVTWYCGREGASIAVAKRKQRLEVERELKLYWDAYKCARGLSQNASGADTAPRAQFSIIATLIFALASHKNPRDQQHPFLRGLLSQYTGKVGRRCIKVEYFALMCLSLAKLGSELFLPFFSENFAKFAEHSDEISRLPLGAGCQENALRKQQLCVEFSTLLHALDLHRRLRGAISQMDTAKPPILAFLDQHKLRVHLDVFSLKQVSFLGSMLPEAAPFVSEYFRVVFFEMRQRDRVRRLNRYDTKDLFQLIHAASTRWPAAHASCIETLLHCATVHDVLQKASLRELSGVLRSLAVLYSGVGVENRTFLDNTVTEVIKRVGVMHGGQTKAFFGGDDFAEVPGIAHSLAALGPHTARCKHSFIICISQCAELVGRFASIRSEGVWEVADLMLLKSSLLAQVKLLAYLYEHKGNQSVMRVKKVLPIVLLRAVNREFKAIPDGHKCVVMHAVGVLCELLAPKEVPIGSSAKDVPAFDLHKEEVFVLSRSIAAQFVRTVQGSGLGVMGEQVPVLLCLTGLRKVIRHATKVELDNEDGVLHRMCSEHFSRVGIERGDAHADAQLLHECNTPAISKVLEQKMTRHGLHRYSARSLTTIATAHARKKRHFISFWKQLDSHCAVPEAVTLSPTDCFHLLRAVWSHEDVSHQNDSKFLKIKLCCIHHLNTFSEKSVDQFKELVHKNQRHAARLVHSIVVDASKAAQYRGMLIAVAAVLGEEPEVQFSRFECAIIARSMVQAQISVPRLFESLRNSFKENEGSPSKEKSMIGNDSQGAWGGEKMCIPYEDTLASDLSVELIQLNLKEVWL